MIIVDANILIFLVNQSAAHHPKIIAWWERLLNGNDPVGIPWLSAVAFFRVATNPKLFDRPLTIGEAVEQFDEWLSVEGVSLASERSSTWEQLRLILLGEQVSANLANDAYLAALAMSRNATLASCDSDFARFAGLRWINPLNAT